MGKLKDLWEIIAGGVELLFANFWREIVIICLIIIVIILIFFR